MKRLVHLHLPITRLQQSLKDNSTEDTKPQTENKGNENEPADTSKESTEKDGKATASENGAEPNIELYKMTLDHILDVMSVPTHSKEEVRMVTYIILWEKPCSL